MKLLRSTENKITKDKNRENVPHLEITEVLLVHKILLIMTISKIQEYYFRLFQISHLVAYQKFHQQIMSFLKTFNSEYNEIKVWFTY